MADLRRLKERLATTYGWRYEVPICPAVIGALHVNNRNQVTVDAATGWSCSWPMMKETERLVLGDIRITHYRELADRVIKYRRSRLNTVRKELARLEHQQPETVFGGCGGDVRQLIKMYLAAYE